MNRTGRAQPVLIYTDSLFAPSETFVTGLIDCVAGFRPNLAILTHRVHGSVTHGRPVTVIPRYFPRWSPRRVANALLRAARGREMFEARLRRLLERSCYDVIHAQFGQPGYHIYRALPSWRRPATRLVVNFYGYDATGLPTEAPEWRRRYEELFRYPNLAVVVEGPVMKTRLAALGCPEEKIHVVPLCLAQPGTSRPEAPRVARDPHVLGFVGRLVEKKGFVFALGGLAPVLKARPDLRLVIIGDGEERSALERLVAAHGLRAQVTLNGVLSHAATLAEVERMGALVVPSMTACNGDSEGGAPTIVAEAQLLGTPVIASDHADIPFALSDHSYLFKEGDERSLLEAVGRYLHDGGRAYDVEAARVRTRERHDRRGIRDRYADIYGGGARG